MRQHRGVFLLGNAFFYMIDRVRRAMGVKKASAGNLAMLERLFMQALNNRTVGPKEGDVQGAFIGSLKDGTRVYETDVDPSLSDDARKVLFEKRIATIFNLGAVKLKTDIKKLLVRADKFTINKNVYGDKKASPNEMDAKYRMLYDLADILNTAKYVPEATEMEPSYKDPTTPPKNKAHQGVKYWYKFRNDIVLDGVGYTVTFNVRDKGKTQLQYLIDVKENGYAVSHTAIEGLRRAYRASTNTNVAQKTPGVNTHSMQEGAGISTEDGGNSAQGALLPPEYRPGARAEGVDPNADVEGDNPSVTADAVPPPFTQGRHAADAANGADLSIDEASVLESAVRSQLQGKKVVDVESPRLPDGQTPPFRQGGQTPSVADGDTSLREGGLQGDGGIAHYGEGEDYS